jgi:hypothetical protein
LLVAGSKQENKNGRRNEQQKQHDNCSGNRNACGSTVASGRNTPFENIRKYIEVGKREGKY